MRQYTQREFIQICVANGFYYSRHNGGHAIYVNDKGRHISIPLNLECVIALRLIKENNLNINIKECRKQKKNLL
nr:MAG TPA: putative RNA-binding protein [Crassvirales sp.]